MTVTPEMFAAAVARYNALSPEEKEIHDANQRASFVRAFTTPCPHGLLDFEQCGDCRMIAAAEREV